MSIKKMALVAFATASAVAVAAVPEVTSVTMSQSDDRLVTISYTLSDAPAVVTVDVQTNASGNGWVSIGGAAVCYAQGDVWKKVETGTRTITWRPDLSWPDHKIADGGARAVVTAWATDNTPDYMVVDISDGAQRDTQRYYPAADFVPGGVANALYKTTMLLMRKIMAKDITWTMGSGAEIGQTTVDAREATHQVKLDGNYYIGVYQVTQSQWHQITGYNPSYFTGDAMMRPVEKVSYYDIRQGKGTAATAASATGGAYPANPYSSSFLGLLREKTNLDFDLPSEAQWEFAARAGNGLGYWGNGSPILSTSTDNNLNLLGRYLKNPTSNSTTASSLSKTTDPSVGGTAVVGSYAKNDWGLYDVHGNVFELCLDMYAIDIKALNGAVNTASSTERAARGGSWSVTPNTCRSAFRAHVAPNNRLWDYGLRVVCIAGLR